MTRIHPSADIHPDAKIGEGVTIWAFAHIGPNAEIDDNCMIGSNALVDCVVGAGSRIQAGAQLYNGVHIGSNVFVGPGVITTNDILPRVGGEWGDRFRETIIRHNAAIGANSTIVCGNTIGAFASIGAGSVVCQDIKPRWLARGNPAQHIRELPHRATGRVEVNP